MYYKKVKELERTIEDLETKQEGYIKKIAELHVKIDALENGHRCRGDYCGHCEHRGPGKIERIAGVLYCTGSTCLLDVPCPDFKRKGGPDPHG